MLKIRRYKPEDNKAVKELNFSGLEQMAPGVNWREPPFLRYSSDLDDIEGGYIDNRGDFLVGIHGREIVTIAGIRKFSATCGEVMRVRVRRDCQRMGYGEKMMLKLMEIAKQSGYKELILDTLTSNLPARQLFEKLGFSEVNRGMRGPFSVIYYGKKLDNGG